MREEIHGGEGAEHHLGADDLVVSGACGLVDVVQSKLELPAAGGLQTSGALACQMSLAKAMWQERGSHHGGHGWLVVRPQPGLNH